MNTDGNFYVLTKTLMGGTEPNNPNGGYSYYQGTVDDVDLGAAASKAVRGFPNNFVYAGYFYGSSAGNRGSSGYYWSSTACSFGDSYYLNFNSSYVSPGTNNLNKYVGQSVRCLFGS